MTLRVAMWSGPRNISTAMMRAWENRGDCAVSDEPLYAHYLDHTGLDHPAREEVIADGDTDWRRVVHGLLGPVPGGARVWYQKHMSHHLLPHIDLPEWLEQQQRERPNSELKTLLAELFTKKMAGLLADNWFASKPLKQYTHAELKAIAEQLGDWQLVPAGTEGYRTAEVTLGGVDTREVSSKTMESRKSPGLYFVGEVLDVTGHLGGFNFQWAWASGYAAAQFV